MDVFGPARLGPVELRNRVIKAATFEGVTPRGLVTDELIDYHLRPVRGGVGMTTLPAASRAQASPAHQRHRRHPPPTRQDKRAFIAILPIPIAILPIPCAQAGRRGVRITWRFTASCPSVIRIRRLDFHEAAGFHVNRLWPTLWGVVSDDTDAASPVSGQNGT